jgi:hypothetical protein
MIYFVSNRLIRIKWRAKMDFPEFVEITRSKPQREHQPAELFKRWQAIKELFESGLPSDAISPPFFSRSNRA